MPGATRRIFIAGYYGFGNAGDEAILAALLADLRALRPDLEFVVASGNPADTENDHGVPAVSRDDLP
ncbi:polysaccharide pyruvyl transferase CsaB, partial [bacterium]